MTSFRGDSDAKYAWCLHALVPAALAGAAAFATVIALFDAFQDLSEMALFWLGLLPVHGVALAACLVVLLSSVPRGARLEALDLKPTPGRGAARVQRALVYTVLFYPLTMVLTLVTVQVLRFMNMEPSVSPLIDYMSWRHGVFGIGSVFVAVVFIAPVAEEILFRLVLYESLRLTGLRIPATVTALLFALLHSQPAEIPALFMLGLLLQYTRRRTGTLWGAIYMHMFFNAISLALALLQTALTSGSL